MPDELLLESDGVGRHVEGHERERDHGEPAHQDRDVDDAGVSEQEQPLLDVLKMKVLLEMFAQGRVIKESAERKKVMWANVMKRFIQQAAERSAARVA